MDILQSGGLNGGRVLSTLSDRFQIEFFIGVLPIHFHWNAQEREPMKVSSGSGGNASGSA